MIKIIYVRIFFFTSYLFFLSFLANAQVLDGIKEAFRGGKGDGYVSRSTAMILAEATLGGKGDGYASLSTVVVSNISFLGGKGDGYALETTRTTANTPAIFLGGKGDGYACCVDGFGSTKIKPLPVEFIFFHSLCNQNSVLLKWATASEFNNDYYTIEKSYDAKIFHMIGTVQGAGTSSVIHKYSYVDNEIASDNGFAYYRLKQTDYNGDITYSDITYVLCNSDLDLFSGNLFPNPANDIVSLVFSTKKSGAVDMQILDVLGRIIIRKNIGVVEGDNLISADIAALEEGVYFFKVSGFGSGVLTCQKFIKYSTK